MDHLNASNNSPYIFYDEEFISSEKINTIRKEEKFTDIILITPDGSKHHLHKIIIFTRCSYFESLFNSGLRESTQTEIELDHNISEELISYIYTGHVEINAENAFVINEQAHFFLLSKLKEATEKVLANNINIENILTHWRWAEKYSNYVEKKSLDFILTNIEIFLEKHLLSLNYGEITIIATNADLANDMLYLNLVKWIKDDFENRQNFIQDLLKCIDFDELSDDFKISEIQTDEVLINTISFSKLMCNIVLNKKTISRVIQPKIEQNSTDLDDLICAIGRDYFGVFTLRQPYPRFAPIIKLNLNDSFQPIHYKDDTILFCGVGDGSNCKSFSYRTNVCNDLSPMLESREEFSITKLYDNIYVCGGLKNNGSIEIYDFNRDKWNYGKSMPQLYDFKITNLNQSIYTFGGRCYYNTINSSGDLVKSSLNSKIIHRFDPRENIWEKVYCDAIEMPYIKEAFVVTENDIKCIYHNGGHIMSVCGYDVRNNNMFAVPREIPQMKDCSLYKTKDKIYILYTPLLQTIYPISCREQHASQFGWETPVDPTPMFGALENLTTIGLVKFTHIDGIKNLNVFHKKCAKFVNVGPDRYNFLDSIEP